MSVKEDELTELLASWDDYSNPTAKTDAGDENLASVLESVDEPPSPKEAVSRVSEQVDELAGKHGAEKPDRLEGLQARVEHIENERADEIENRDAEEAISWLEAEGIYTGGDRQHTKMRLLAAWMNDEGFQQAWQNRDTNKAGFHARLRDIGQTLADEQASAQSNSNRKLAGAVRAARESHPAPAGSFDLPFGKMSDSEFSLAKAEVFQAAKDGRLR